MTDSRSGPDAGLQSTDVRFSMRTLLLVTVPVALIAAVAGCFMRAFAPEARARVAFAWIGWSTLVVAWIAFVATRRIRFEKLAGQTIVRLPIYGMSPLWRVVNRYLLCGMLALLGLASLFLIAERAADATSIGAALLAAVHLDALLWAGLVAHCVTLWWWSRDIRICDTGVLWDRRFVRWSDVHERWDPDRDCLTLYGLDQRSVELRCDVVVPEEQRNAVEALLREKLQKAPTTAIGLPT